MYCMETSEKCYMLSLDIIWDRNIVITYSHTLTRVQLTGFHLGKKLDGFRQKHNSGSALLSCFPSSKGWQRKVRVLLQKQKTLTIYWPPLLSHLFAPLESWFPSLSSESGKLADAERNSSSRSDCYSEANPEPSKQITMSSLDINVSLHHGLPFFDHRANFVITEVDAMELCQTVFALNTLRN